MEKIFVQLKKETVDKIKEVPLIKQEFNDKLARMHNHKDHKGAPQSAKTVKLTPQEAHHRLK